MTRIEKIEKKKKNKKFINALTLGFTIITLFLIYNLSLLGPIEPILRIILILILLLIVLRCFISRPIVIHNQKKRKRFIYSYLLLSLLFIILSIYIFMAYTSVNAFHKQTSNYSIHLVTLKDSSLQKVNDIKKKKIGLIQENNSDNFTQFYLEIINQEKLLEQNEVEEYEDYQALLQALYEKQVDVIFLPENYISMFSSIATYKNIKKETKSIYTNTKKILNTASNSSIEKPFTVLIMGIDSTSDVLTSNETGNSDTLQILSFNPNTLSLTMLSIPRDSYVNISCMNKKNKITHAGWYGESCVEQTIENFLDIDIDYYIKVNFKALVHIVNQLGGIEVEVPKDLCTDNSNRTGQVCIKKGKQTLNGEEALVLARNRKQLTNGDIDRGLNQQLVMKAILNAAGEKIKNISTMYQLIDILSNNIDTNFTTEQILSFYNVGKNIIQKSQKKATDSLHIQPLYLSGEGMYIYDQAMKLNLYNYVLYDESIQAVSDAIQENLGIKKITRIKTFAWSIDEDYHTIPIGKMSEGNFSNAGDLSSSNSNSSNNKNNQQEEKKEANLVFLPNFVGKDKSYVEKWCSSNHIYVVYSYQNVDSTYMQNQVLSQNVSAGTDIRTMGSLKITLANIIENKSPSQDSEKEENTVNTN